MKYYYSPHTGEIIKTEYPAEWMGVTDIEPPEFDNQTAGCYYRNGAWEVVKSTPDTTQLAIDARRQRNSLIDSVQPRIDRALRQSRMGETPIDDIAKLDAYVQELADIPNQPGFPVVIEWPVAP
jgi:hypothetical protein